MTRQQAISLAAFGSALLLAAAFVFQWFGWAPCKMCLWQRWPHVAAIAIGATALLVGPWRLLAALGAAAALTTAAIATYHSGVELKWWPGPASCSGTGPGLGGLTGDQLLPGAADIVPVVLCDTLTPFFLGLTMANWNMLASVGLAAVWVYALRCPSRPVA